MFSLSGKVSAVDFFVEWHPKFRNDALENINTESLLLKKKSSRTSRRHPLFDADGGDVNRVSLNRHHVRNRRYGTRSV